MGWVNRRTFNDALAEREALFVTLRLANTELKKKVLQLHDELEGERANSRAVRKRRDELRKRRDELLAEVVDLKECNNTLLDERVEARSLHDRLQREIEIVRRDYENMASSGNSARYWLIGVTKKTCRVVCRADDWDVAIGTAEHMSDKWCFLIDTLGGICKCVLSWKGKQGLPATPAGS